MADISTLPDLVARLAEKRLVDFDKQYKAIGIKLFSGVIKSSPVDTGRFKDNWFATVDRPSDYVFGGDSGIDSESQAAKTVKKWKVGKQPIYLTNNLPYSNVIEYGGYSTGSAGQTGSKVTSHGYSKQAPSGVVRASMRRIRYSILQELKQ